MLLGNNVDGLRNKMESLEQNIRVFSPTVITLQETNLKRKGLLKIKGYELYEKVCSNSSGGGLLTAIDEN